MSVLDLGASLRAERLRQGLSLRETARRLGISASALSQIETGKAHPSVGKLFDIVNLLNVSVDGLLAGDGTAARGDQGFVSLQRAGEHETLELEAGVRWRRLTAGSYPGVEFLHVEYQPGGSSSGDGTSMRHAGQEFGYVLARAASPSGSASTPTSWARATPSASRRPPPTGSATTAPSRPRSSGASSAGMPMFSGT